MLIALNAFYVVFGLLTLVGGIIGYVKKKSVPSIISGSLIGIVLLAAPVVFGYRSNLGLMMGLVASVAVAGKFVPDYLHRHAFFPAGIMALFGALGIAFTIAAWYYL